MYCVGQEDLGKIVPSIYNVDQPTTSEKEMPICLFRVNSRDSWSCWRHPLSSPIQQTAGLCATNTFSDFPPDQFEILAFCEVCGHQAMVKRSPVLEDSIVQDLTNRLRCSECGSRECSIRIVFSGAGGYQYGRTMAVR